MTTTGSSAGVSVSAEDDCDNSAQSVGCSGLSALVWCVLVLGCLALCGVASAYATSVAAERREKARNLGGEVKRKRNKKKSRPPPSNYKPSHAPSSQP